MSIPHDVRAMLARREWDVRQHIGGATLFSHFANNLVGLPLEQQISGAGAAVGSTGLSIANRFGVLQLSTGTTSTGRAGFGILGSRLDLRLGQGPAIFACDLRIADLAVPLSEDYDLFAGFIDAFSAESTDGVYVEYDATQSANWLFTASNNGSRTSLDSGVAVAADVFVRPELYIAADGLAVDCYLNGSSVGRIAANNIPTASGREVGVGGNVIKTTGATPRQVFFDWCLWHWSYTTPPTWD